MLSSQMRQEATMPNVNLSAMSVEALMDLRKRVDEMLHKRRAEIETQLESIAVVSGARVVRGGGNPLSPHSPDNALSFGAACAIQI
jgi:hypothetical protein